MGCALARWGDATPTATLMPQQQRVTSFQSSIAEVLEYLHADPLFLSLFFPAAGPRQAARDSWGLIKRKPVRCTWLRCAHGRDSGGGRQGPDCGTVQDDRHG